MWYFLLKDHQLRNIIDKLAQFVARNGPEFEQMTKQKQRDNPRFYFLFGGEYFNYYQYRVTTEQAILRQKQKIEEQQQQQAQHFLPQQQQQTQHFLPQQHFPPSHQDTLSFLVPSNQIVNQPRQQFEQPPTSVPLFPPHLQTPPSNVVSAMLMQPAPIQVHPPQMPPLNQPFPPNSMSFQMNSPQFFGSVNTNNMPPKEVIPDVPYYDLPAGLMVPLVKLEDFEYKAINPKDIRLPPPAPPSERLLQAVEMFYAAPSHERPRNSDGWEQLGLYEFFKAKSQAQKLRAHEHTRVNASSS